MLNYSLTADDRAFWTKNQYLHLKQPFSVEQTQALRTWTDELARWPESPGQWMKYFESRAETGERQLCRVENFIEYHEGLHGLICGGGVFDILDELMGEAALLFKEKINYKLPGGSGFGAHQDAPAFTTFGQTYHITMLVAVDHSTVANGCLEVSAPVPAPGLLAQEADGTIDRTLESQLAWEPLPTRAGDVVFFDSYLPHRSQANRSERPRRALYVTYNRASEQDVRAQYYAHKRSVFPPECEREAGVDYTLNAGPYNLGNPIR